MVVDNSTHEQGRALVAGIIKRKQEDQAWKEWEAKQPRYQSPRPVTQWPHGKTPRPAA